VTVRVHIRIAKIGPREFSTVRTQDEREAYNDESSYGSRLLIINETVKSVRSLQERRPAQPGTVTLYGIDFLCAGNTTRSGPHSALGNRGTMDNG